ncbi:D-alanyl-D-alanine carboxypeptidase [Streptomyces sp. ACA25]|uniref:D-alanyl-D-alanine carboxypeptidase family protein n=1 Tax=Streptomyces sp. ACA25 TaxID=3022596 RepID=UPI0023070910|nr:D-alanyl-D-alanine carboxypeptidase [Streptomyces sp. ACA25]MDB1087079.1 D-alanyl-D-alanine carboxypeptidase [Streptomyces sp. ACA25]
MASHQRSVPRTPGRSRGALLSLAGAVLWAALGPVPGAAAQESKPEERPPAEMSTLGGDLLGRPGPQMLPRTGAPEPPALPELSARAWIVADAETGEVLAAHHAHWPLAPASTLKMLFADLLLPKFDPDDVYEADPAHFSEMGRGSSAVGIKDHQTYTVDDLWYGAFLASGNDAVHALTAMNGGREKTVREMNDRARELQAYNTLVVNPDGYDGAGQRSSAYDLTLIARSGMQNPDFRRYAATARYSFPGAGEGKKRPRFEIQSTNRLLTGARGLAPYPGLAGIKNGYTSQAGYTFTGIAERDGRKLLVTCMNPDGDGLQVYRETAALFDWGFEAAGSVEPVGELVPSLSEVAEAEAALGPQPSQGGEAEETATDRAVVHSRPELPGVPVLTVAAAGMALLAVVMWVFHRRHPLPGRPPGGAPRR